MTDRKASRGGLGRGLSALMADVKSSSGFSETPPQPTSMLPVESLIPNPDQPRRDFDEVALQELAESIRQKGVVQPLIVRPGAAQGQFEIVAGERRWRAAQIAGLHQVPVIVRDYSDEEVLEIAIIENIQRADLNAVEEAMAYRQLMDRFGHTQDKLAASLSRSRSHIANTLRLLSLPEGVQKLLREGGLSAGHARALITAPDSARLAAEVVRRGLSVRETERLVKTSANVAGGGASKSRRKATTKDADTRAIEADLSANLRMHVSINHAGAGEGGVLSIAYRSLADLDMLCDVLSKIPRDILGR